MVGRAKEEDMKNAKIVAEWDDNKGGAFVTIDGKTSDVYALLCTTVMQFFDVSKIPDSVGLAAVAHGVASARKALLAKVEIDALRRASEEKGHE